MAYDYVYTRRFEATQALLRHDWVMLRCEGLDTLAEIWINGSLAGRANNMHRIWEYDAKAFLHPGTNELKILFHSPTKEAERLYQRSRANGIPDAMEGFPHIRKAHCMYGWDWGPRLPDAGIWRNILLAAYSGVRLGHVHVRQTHGADRVTLRIESQLDCMADAQAFEVRVAVTDPDGACFLASGTSAEVVIENPQLWWPNGMGVQPLYHLEVMLLQEGILLEKRELRIGLRTLTVRREPDAWGESFAHEVNGVPFFAMGANYIPEDNILRRVTKKRTRMLLQHAADAHLNVIRVWGGGYYPDDFFYDLCDELGLVVWQDFMFTWRALFLDNLRRNTQ